MSRDTSRRSSWRGLSGMGCMAGRASTSAEPLMPVEKLSTLPSSDQGWAEGELPAALVASRKPGRSEPFGDSGCLSARSSTRDHMDSGIPPCAHSSRHCCPGTAGRRVPLMLMQVTSQTGQLCANLYLTWRSATGK